MSEQVYIDTSESLSHYGVKGMRWGHRKDGMSQGYQGRSGKSKHPMTKRQAKKAIRTAKRNYRHETGEWTVTGKNMADVQKEHMIARENDAQLKDAADRMKKLNDAIENDQYIVTTAKETKDHLTRLQNDPSSSKEMRRSVDERYQREREEAKQASKRIEQNYEKYDQADSDYYNRTREIASAYREKYKEAAVKDIGIEDVQAGVKMLEEYRLVRKATGGRVGGLQDPNRY